MTDLDKIDFETVDVDVDEDGKLWLIEDNDEAMEEAMSDIEEEYESDTVSDYMNYGVQEK